MDSTPTLTSSARVGAIRGLRAVGVLARVMLPVYVVVDLLRTTPLLPWAAERLAPLMAWLGLPGEAALVLVAGGCVNLYAAIAAAAPLGLEPREVTLLGLMLGLAHGLPLETAIVRQVCPRWLLLAVLRVATALLAGAVVHRVMP